MESQHYCREQAHWSEIILAETPLYAESGGQVSDKGVLEGSNFQARDCRCAKACPWADQSHVEITQGELSLGMSSTLGWMPSRATKVPGPTPRPTLIHAALRDTLGPHATQAGSLNRPGYLRLDFSWNQALSADAQVDISQIANNAIRDDLEVTTRILAVDEAKAQGAMALFGEKYGDSLCAWSISVAPGLVSCVREPTSVAFVADRRGQRCSVSLP